MKFKSLRFEQDSEYFLYKRQNKKGELEVRNDGGK